MDQSTEMKMVAQGNISIVKKITEPKEKISTKKKSDEKKPFWYDQLHSSSLSECLYK